MDNFLKLLPTIPSGRTSQRPPKGFCQESLCRNLQERFLATLTGALSKQIHLPSPEISDFSHGVIC